MIIRNVRKIILLSLISLLYSPLLWADAPYEKYHVAYKDISKEVLKNTIGIMTINSRIGKAPELRTYLRSGNEFTFDKILDAKETIPVSNFGWHPAIDERYVMNYRYPIVSRFDHDLCIIYDPVRNLKAWINLKESDENFHTTSVFLDSIPIPSEFWVDIFSFTEDGTRRIYKQPKRDAESVLISKDLFGQSFLKITEQKNGFIKIEGPAWVSQDVGKGQIELRAWIRMRDEKGDLKIWIKVVDWMD